MQAHLKSAAITIAVVLVGVYILRQAPVVGPMVDKALNG